MSKKTPRSKLEIQPVYSTSEEMKEDMIECCKCRHSNHKTNEREDGFIACKFTGSIKVNPWCDLTFPTKDGTYYMYEPYNGQNCTWDIDADFIVSTEKVNG